ncbi:hypothetical protein, partial [Thomasclavelia cocleata]|uniref:hypothetical protein n=1 Tax=Thomasclavelia cocleata TaxID=69824 RepID=UPI00256F4289
IIKIQVTILKEKRRKTMRKTFITICKGFNITDASIRLLREMDPDGIIGATYSGSRFKRNDNEFSLEHQKSTLQWIKDVGLGQLEIGESECVDLGIDAYFVDGVKTSHMPEDGFADYEEHVYVFYGLAV